MIDEKDPSPSRSETDVEVEIQFEGKPHWYKTTITMAEHAQMMSKGMLHDRLLAKCALFYVTNVCMVYDFKLAKQGLNPWIVEGDT